MIQITENASAIDPDQKRRITRQNNVLYASLFALVLFGTPIAMFGKPLLSLAGISASRPWLFLGGGGSVVIIMLLRTQREHSRLRLDLKTSQASSWKITAKRVIRVVPHGTWEALAFDCGENTLVLQGDWLLDVNERFPTSEFTLAVLPRSRMVAGVQTQGEELSPLDDLDGKIAFLKEASYVEAEVINAPIELALDWRTKPPA